MSLRQTVHYMYAWRQSLLPHELKSDIWLNASRTGLDCQPSLTDLDCWPSSLHDCPKQDQDAFQLDFLNNTGSNREYNIQSIRKEMTQNKMTHNKSSRNTWVCATERILAWKTDACFEAQRNTRPTCLAQYWPAFALWATVQFPAKQHTAGSSWISSCMQTSLCPSLLHLKLGRIRLGRVPATMLSLKRTAQELPATCNNMANANTVSI